MKAKVQKKSIEVKLNNDSFDALRKIEIINPNSDLQFKLGLIDFNYVLNHYDWDFNKDRKKYPDFRNLGRSMLDHYKKGNISKYQKFCLVKLSSILYDAKVLYENNLIDFSELYAIVVRVRNDAHKRFKYIEKAASKQSLKDQNLDKNSLVLLQAKLAILENQN